MTALTLDDLSDNEAEHAVRIAQAAPWLEAPGATNTRALALAEALLQRPRDGRAPHLWIANAAAQQRLFQLPAFPRLRARLLIVQSSIGPAALSGQPFGHALVQAWEDLVGMSFTVLYVIGQEVALVFEWAAVSDRAEPEPVVLLVLFRAPTPAAAAAAASPVNRYFREQVFPDADDTTDHGAIAVPPGPLTLVTTAFVDETLCL
jgi:hypothetical protein